MEGRHNCFKKEGAMHIMELLDEATKAYGGYLVCLDFGSINGDKIKVVKDSYEFRLLVMSSSSDVLWAKIH